MILALASLFAALHQSSRLAQVHDLRVLLTLASSVGWQPEYLLARLEDQGVSVDPKAWLVAVEQNKRLLQVGKVLESEAEAGFRLAKAMNLEKLMLASANVHLMAPLSGGRVQDALWNRAYKAQDLLLCGDCGGARLQETAWVDSATGTFDDVVATGTFDDVVATRETRCETCGEGDYSRISVDSNVPLSLETFEELGKAFVAGSVNLDGWEVEVDADEDAFIYSRTRADGVIVRVRLRET
jgi:hypothetical protein